MKLAALFSGGKDSGIALHKAKKENNKIIYLLSIFPKNNDSFMFHKPNLKLLKKQAKQLELKLILQKSDGKENKELKDLEKLISKVKDKVGGIITGGIASSYQGNRIKKICDKFNLKLITPLWGYKPKDLWTELLNNNFKIIITKICCDGLSKKWIGKTITKENIKDLEKLSIKHKFRMDFEGGEAETAILSMPGFKKDIKINFDITSEDSYRHSINIKNIK